MDDNYDFPYDDTVDYSNYYFFDREFSKAEIAKIHTLAKKYDFEVATTAKTSKEDKNLNTIRKSKIKWLPKNKDFHWLYNRVGKLIEEANDQLYKFDLTGMREDFQYTIYPKDAGHYDWHMDIGGPGIMTQRKLSITIELTEHGVDYEGGLLQANLGNGLMDLPQGAGTAVLFPSFFVHRVTPVTKGERKSIVLWVGGNHYK
tara:strand:+ start:353 stop:958 length:606 start_codon:yes stop_codon:yes gene_type:complete